MKLIRIFLTTVIAASACTALHAQESTTAVTDSTWIAELMSHRQLPIEASASRKKPPLPAGYNFAPGKKVKIGKGTGNEGRFNFVRLYSVRPYRYSEETRNKSLNSINPAGAGLAGSELVIHKIVYGQGRRKAPEEYWLINVPTGGLFRIEIELEPALKSGELEVPE